MRPKRVLIMILMQFCAVKLHLFIGSKSLHHRSLCVHLDFAWYCFDFLSHLELFILTPVMCYWGGGRVGGGDSQMCRATSAPSRHCKVPPDSASRLCPPKKQPVAFLGQIFVWVFFLFFLVFFLKRSRCMLFDSDLPVYAPAELSKSKNPTTAYAVLATHNDELNINFIEGKIM